MSGETGRSTFKEREAKSKIKWLMRVAFSEAVVAEIGRACLLEVGLKSKWWKRVKYLCEKTELCELSNVICLGDCNMRGLRVLNVDDSKGKVCKRVKKVELLSLNE